MKRNHLTLAVLFAVSLAVQIGALFLLLGSHDAGIARDINLAGKQRMLSQRIAFGLNRIPLETDASRRTEIERALNAAIDEMERNHQRHPALKIRMLILQYSGRLNLLPFTHLRCLTYATRDWLRE